MKKEHWEELEGIRATLRCSDDFDAEADAIEKILEAHQPYDHIDAAYIFKRLLQIHMEGARGRLTNGGDLDQMSAMWNLAIEAAQIIHELVHEDEYNRRAVWAYEVIDAENATLPVELWEGHRQDRSTRNIIDSWCSHAGIRRKTDLEPDVELALRQLIEKVIAAVADYKLKIPASLWADLNRAVK